MATNTGLKGRISFPHIHYPYLQQHLGHTFPSLAHSLSIEQTGILTKGIRNAYTTTTRMNDFLRHPSAFEHKTLVERGGNGRRGRGADVVGYWKSRAGHRLMIDFFAR